MLRQFLGNVSFLLIGHLPNNVEFYDTFSYESIYPDYF